jgi:hypothetical protein
LCVPTFAHYATDGTAIHQVCWDGIQGFHGQARKFLQIFDGIALQRNLKNALGSQHSLPAAVQIKVSGNHMQDGTTWVLALLVQPST